MKKYFYRLDSWAEDSWEPFETDDYTGYHAAANEIAREADAHAAEYPDERVVFVRYETHDRARKFVVYAETDRVYMARESLEEK